MHKYKRLVNIIYDCIVMSLNFVTLLLSDFSPLWKVPLVTLLPSLNVIHPADWRGAPKWSFDYFQDCLYSTGFTYLMSCWKEGLWSFFIVIIVNKLHRLTGWCHGERKAPCNHIKWSHSPLGRMFLQTTKSAWIQVGKLHITPYFGARIVRNSSSPHACSSSFLE